MYAERNQTIKDTVPAERLTVWNLGDGWAPLAQMLGVDVPDEEFPRLHDTNNFRIEMGLPPMPDRAGSAPRDARASS
jgi:hypothetical protein